MYSRLLSVKEQRERSAADSMRRQRNAVENQEQRLQRAERSARDFTEFRTRREQELFEEIRGEEVTLQDLKLMQARVAGLRQEEAQKEQQVAEEAQPARS